MQETEGDPKRAVREIRVNGDRGKQGFRVDSE